MASGSNNKEKLIKFTDGVQKFIFKNKMEDLAESLIIDYCECLWNNGVDVTTLDIEQTVYTFYGYFDKYSKYIDAKGENAFIKLIVSEEIAKAMHKDWNK